LIVAAARVVYTGRLTAFLPESTRLTRLLMLKADGSVLVHADAGGYKPPNCIYDTPDHRFKPNPRVQEGWKGP